MSMAIRERYPTQHMEAAYKAARELHTALLERLQNPLNKERVREEAKKQVEQEYKERGIEAPPLPNSPQAKVAQRHEESKVEASPSGPTAPRNASTEEAPKVLVPQAADASAKPDADQAEADGNPPAKAAPLPGKLMAQVQALEKMASREQAVSERGQLEQMARQAKIKVPLYLISIAFCTLVLAYLGIGSYGAVLLHAKAWFQVPLTLMLSAAAGALVALLGHNLAKQRELWRLSTRAPERISSLIALRSIYKTELFGPGELGEAEQHALNKKVEAAHHAMLQNKDSEDLKQDAKFTWAVFGLALVTLLAGVLMQQPHQNWEEVAKSSSVAAFLASMLLVCIRALGPYTQPLPVLGEDLMDPAEAAKEAQAIQDKHQTAEQIRMAAEAAQAKRDQEANTQKTAATLAANQKSEERKNQKEIVQTSQAMADARNRYELELKKTIEERAVTIQKDLEIEEHKSINKLYQELQEATEQYEQQRGFSTKERKSLAQANRNLVWSTFFWGFLSIAAGIFATYPASLTSAEIFGFSYQYFFGNRVSLLPWGSLFILMIVADWCLIHAYSQRAKSKTEGIIFKEGYKESIWRSKGIRYHFKLPKQVAETVRTTRKMIAFGIAALSVEFAMNAFYLIQNSEANLTLALIMALAPFVMFLALTFPHVFVSEKRVFLGEALSWANTLPEDPPALPTPHLVPGASSVQANHAAEELGVLDISQRRKLS